MILQKIKKRKPLTGKTIAALLLVSCLFFFLAAGFYNKLEVTRYSIINERIPASFNGFKIVQLSDFHCKDFGTEEELLIDQISGLRPDLIVFTGDFIDSSHKNIENVSLLLKGISSLCPIYSVSGNHEFDDWNQYVALMDLYRQYNVLDLDDSSIALTKGKDTIQFSGFKWGSTLPAQEGFSPGVDAYSVLLYHNSNEFNHLSTLGFDLILAGHTHGGLIRLPFFGGVIGNNGSLFPEFAGGLFTKQGCTMISSRGLGDSYFPRFFNRPQVVEVTLYSEAASE